MLVSYLDVVKFPKLRKQNYIRFYWHARPYLLMISLKERLPLLSAKLTGELVQVLLVVVLLVVVAVLVEVVALLL
jgi:hypothetical protein